MAVAFRAAANYNETDPTTTFTVTIPASVQADDDLYLTVYSDNHGSGSAYPTVVDDDAGGNTWTRKGETAANRRCTLWHKKATADTASKTVTVDGCLSSCAGGLAAYSGALAADPMTNFSGSQNTSGTESVTGFTPDVADSFICMSIANAGIATVSNTACTDPGTLTERYEKSGVGGSDCGSAHASAVQSGGPTATGNFTWSQSDDVTHTMVWAIKPTAAASGKPKNMHYMRSQRAA